MRCAVIALVAFPSIASAQPSVSTPVEYQVTETVDTGQVSPSTSTLLSIGGSAIGVATIWMGSKMHGGDTPIMELGAAISLVGPSSGQWYAHGSAYFTPGLGIRLGGGLLMALGFGAAIDHACHDGMCDTPIRDHNSDTLIGLGAVVAAGGMLYDIATAGSEARKVNSRRRVAIDPLVMSTASGHTTGVGLSGSF
jgi:hypothetical protein